uniref:DUF3592 domain-containing protein n=1 Tax=Herbaspirillum sp. DW155 TaxID=3095609 RepID=UPI00403F96A0
MVNGKIYIEEDAAKSYGYQARWYRVESTAEQGGLVGPVGKQVHVYYDPHASGRSVLARQGGS